MTKSRVIGEQMGGSDFSLFNMNTTPTIWVTEFNSEDARSFFNEFVALQGDNSIDEIVIYVDSFGGGVDALCTMAELVEASTKPVTTVCIGKAMSAGGILVSLGHPGKRWIGPNSRFMIHRISGGAEGDSAFLETLTKEVIRLNNFWLKKIVSRSNISWKEFNDKLKELGGEWYMTATEAVKYGFADRIGVPIVKDKRNVVIEIGSEKVITPAKKKSAKKAKPTKGKTDVDKS